MIHWLDLQCRLHNDFAAPGAIGFFRAFCTKNDSGSREVGTRHELDQVFNGSIRVIEQVHDRIGNLTQIVRRNAGTHANGDAFAAIAEEVRELAGKHDGFTLQLIVVGHEVYGVVVNVLHHFHCNGG